MEPVAEAQLLQSALAGNDPIQFVLMEDFLRTMTEARAPRWSPSLMFTPGGWDKYKRGQATRRQVDELIEQMWIKMVEGILQSRNHMVAWQMGAAQRQLEWAEQLRQTRDLQTAQLDYQEKLSLIEDNKAKLQDKRNLTHDLAVKKVDFIYQKELEAMRQGQNDPVQRMERYRQAVEMVKPDLDAIAKSNYSTAVKNQLSSMIMAALEAVRR